ncbi:MAG: AAA-like domain-containing protein [Verrucomicrobiota bacterium]
MSADSTSFFVTGGTMSPDAPSYVVRSADEQLLTALLASEFCYVLTSRQMGKSSLMVRTTTRLRAAGVTPLVLDLTAIGTNVTPDQWYGGLVARLGRILNLEDDVEAFWTRHQHIGPLQRLMATLHDLILPKLPAQPQPGHASSAQSGPVPPAKSQLVIFVDEIDAVRSLSFATDEFFAAIRECYHRRAEEPAFRHLTFCLLGVATPSDLIRDPRTTPFNIGRRIDLTDFSPAEAAALVEGWDRGPRSPVQTMALLDRVLFWTGGHPYLTQRLSQAIASHPESTEPAAVDRLCEELFFSPRAREQEDNLLYVRERLLRAECKVSDVLRLYQRVWSGEAVADKEGNRPLDTLRLAGVVRVDQGTLAVRNRIYQRVFDGTWLNGHLPPTRATEPGSIAVLPFALVGAEPGLEYLADGLTDELIAALGRMAGLRVASRTSAFQFKGRHEDVRIIGEQLLVRHLLQGTLRQVGPAFEVAAQLIQGAEGHCRWSETYRETASNLGQVQDRIAAAVAGQLSGEMRSPTPVATVRSGPQAEAYNLYLKGRFAWNRRTERDVRRSIELFQDASHKDPVWPMPYAGLADAFNILATYNYVRPLEAYPKAKEAAARALALDPTLAQAHCALACTSCVHDWDWARGEEAFRQAISLNPSYATARHWLAINCLAPLGRHDEALGELQRAQEVDPLSISITASIGLALYLSGRDDDAIDQCRQAVELDDTFWIGQLFLGWACLRRERYEEAIAALQASLAGGNHDPVAWAGLAYAYAVAGETAQAKDLLTKLKHLAQTRYVPAMELVPVYLALGDTDAAVRQLHDALLERSFKLIYLKVDPRVRDLCEHPQVLPILRQIGLERHS